MNGRDRVASRACRLDLENGCIWRGSRRITLSATDGALLGYLSSRSGQLVTHDELLSALWAGITVGSGLLKVRIRRLRRLLGDRVDRPRFIETVHGRGYRFIAVGAMRALARPQRDEATMATERFVGRAAELELLRHHLDQAFAGKRQAVFIAGEPGVGKSALVRALLARAVDPERVWIGYGQCIEARGRAEAHMPVLEALGRACRGPHGQVLQHRLRTVAPSWLAQMPALLTARGAQRLRRAAGDVTSERLVRELAEGLDVVTAERPMVLWLEDIHWSDVSSLMLLSAIAQRPDAARLFIVATYRPVDALATNHPLIDVARELETHERCRLVSLGALSSADVAAYLDACFGRHAFPSALADALHRRTEGHPLFLTRLIQDLVARGDIVDVAGQWALRTSVDALASTIPATIRQLVDRQRERLSETEQAMLAAASLVGATFSAPLVAAALERPIATVEDACARLAERQFFIRPAGVARWPDGTVAAAYTFVHAVYQALWDERIGPTTRQEWHRRIGERLERAYGDGAGDAAAELAMHFKAAASDAKAVRHLRRAAVNAMLRSAPHEAIVLARDALGLLGSVTDAAERADAERELRFILARLELVRNRYAAPEVFENYARLHELSREREQDRRLFPILVGLVRFHLHRAELDTAHQLALQALRLAEATADGRLAGAQILMASVQFNLGRPTIAHDYLQSGLALHQPHRSGKLAQLCGEDLEVPALAYRAVVEWHLGYSARALESSRAAVTTARALGLPAPLAFAIGLAAWLHRLRREPDTTRALATELRALATDHGFPFWIAQATFELGWGLAACGRADDGRALMQEGLERYGATGARMHEVGNRIASLEIGGNADRSPARALAVVDELLTNVARIGQRYHESALHRLRGEILADLADDTGADDCFQRAVQVAAQQGAKLLELRAAMSRARRWQRRGRAKEARMLLRRSYGWFTEGFETPDLRDARALIAQLDSS